MMAGHNYWADTQNQGIVFQPNFCIKMSRQSGFAGRMMSSGASPRIASDCPSFRSTPQSPRFSDLKRRSALASSAASKSRVCRMPPSSSPSVMRYFAKRSAFENVGAKAKAPSLDCSTAKVLGSRGKYLVRTIMRGDRHSPPCMPAAEPHPYPCGDFITLFEYRGALSNSGACGSSYRHGNKFHLQIQKFARGRARGSDRRLP